MTARSVEITPETSGHVKEILFKDGAFIKKDTALVQLDDAVYQAKYQSIKAQLAYIQTDYHRKSLLEKKGVISLQAIDEVRANLKEKTANAEESAVLLSKMKLVAPFDGMVGKSKISLGDYVTPGQGLVTLTDIEHLRIEYNVPEKYLPKLKLNQEVKLTTSTYPDKIFTGKISFISPTINPDNRSIALYAEINNEDHTLAAGMFVNVSQFLGQEEQVIIIPARSLIPILDGEQVYKIVDGKAFAVTVNVGRRINEDIQITQGLSPGDRVITDGHLKVKNNMPVKYKS